MAALRSAFAKLTPGTAVRKPTVSLAGRPATGKLAMLQTIAPQGGVSAGAAPAAPDAAAMPINPQFGADVNSAQLNLSTTEQQNEAARSQLGSQYGFGVDASGNVIDDHSNPYSRAAALQTAHDIAVRGTNTSYAARGQLYAGSRINAQNYNETQALKGRDQLIREFMAQRSGLANSDAAARNAYLSAIGQASAANAQFALDHPPDVASTATLQGTPGATSAAPFKTVPGKDSKGNAGVWHVYPDGRKVFVRG